MLTQVTGECLPFSDKWLDQLDQMSNTNAIDWVTKHLQACIISRNKYENAMLASYSKEFEGYLHAWIIDCNNIVRFKRLLMEIENE